MRKLVAFAGAYGSTGFAYGRYSYWEIRVHALLMSCVVANEAVAQNEGLVRSASGQETCGVVI